MAEIYQSTCYNIKRYFRKVLEKRGWEGTLEIDEANERLTINVLNSKDMQRSKVKEKKYRELKSLSGGERSFVSVCFVMTLGREIASPSMLLDEFDVFMDADNR